MPPLTVVPASANLERPVMSLEDRLAASPGAQGRDRMADACAHRLMHMAHRALDVRGMDPMSFLVACIAVDSSWRPVVDELMPGNEQGWQAERDHGAMPVAMGIVMRAGFQDMVLRDNPGLQPSLTSPPASGHAHLLVLDDTGGTVYDVPARAHIPH